MKVTVGCKMMWPYLEPRANQPWLGRDPLDAEQVRQRTRLLNGGLLRGHALLESLRRVAVPASIRIAAPQIAGR